MTAPDVANTTYRIPWSVLEQTWKGLTRMMPNFDPSKSGWETLVEARRVVEIEMRMQGYDDKMRALR